MTCIALACFPTDSAARYANRTGRHWARNLAVDEAGDARDARVITFPTVARRAGWPGDAKVTPAPKGGSTEGLTETDKSALE